MKSTLRVTIAFGLLFIVFVSRTDVSSAEEKDTAENGEDTIKIYKRLIPADVLRGELCYLKNTEYRLKCMQV